MGIRYFVTSQTQQTNITQYQRKTNRREHIQKTFAHFKLWFNACFLFSLRAHTLSRNNNVSVCPQTSTHVWGTGSEARGVGVCFRPDGQMLGSVCFAQYVGTECGRLNANARTSTARGLVFTSSMVGVYRYVYRFYLFNTLTHANSALGT